MIEKTMIRALIFTSMVLGAMRSTALLSSASAQTPGETEGNRMERKGNAEERTADAEEAKGERMEKKGKAEAKTKVEDRK